MYNLKSLALSALLYLTFTSLSAQLSIQIPQNVAASPIPKTGWNLIFEETFNHSTTLNTNVWNKSSWGDDQSSCDREIGKNPDNISVSGGTCKLILNNNDYHGCTYSAGEIKTFSSDPSFLTYQFLSDSYIEIRAKLPAKKDGIGSAAWLYDCYGKYTEIDIWETGEETYKFKGSYYWQDGPGITNIIECGEPKMCEVRGNADWISVSDQINQFVLVDLTSQFLNWGAEWNMYNIKWYLNGVLAKTITLNSTPPDENDPDCPDAYDDPNHGMPEPVSLRIGIGPDLSNDEVNSSDLPQQLEIQYIRVYKKEGTVAAPVTLSGGTGQICKTGGGTVKAQYYPGASYSWDQTNFNVEPTSNAALYPSEVWATPNCTSCNQSYPLTATITFPRGYVETNTVNIYVPSTSPLTPTGGMSSSRMGFTCYYYAKKNKIANTWFEWSDDNVNWYPSAKVDGGFEYWGMYDPNTTNSVYIRSVNSCGASASVLKTFTTGDVPSGGCNWRTNGDEVGNTFSSLFDGELAVSTIAAGKFQGFVSSEFISEGSAFLSVLDISGRIIESQSLIADEFLIDLSEKPVGIYLVTVWNQSGNFASCKIANQH